MKVTSSLRVYSLDGSGLFRFEVMISLLFFLGGGVVFCIMWTVLKNEILKCLQMIFYTSSLFLHPFCVCVYVYICLNCVVSKASELRI